MSGLGRSSGLGNAQFDRLSQNGWHSRFGKMLTDPVWWFYLTWLPSYLQRERGVTLASAAGALLVIYLAADLGSVFGGWLPAFFLGGVGASRFARAGDPCPVSGKGHG